VLAAPEGTGQVFVIDPATLETTDFGTGGATASADADARTIFVADRGSNRIVAFDAATTARVASIDLDANPDYVRVAPGRGELWVTVPGQDRTDVIAVAGDPVSLARVDSIPVPGAAEGLSFGEGRAYTQAGGRAIAIDVERRVVVGDWDTGCGGSHGFAQVDDGYGLIVAGCRGGGGAAVLTRQGEQRSGYETGGDAAVLAYDAARHHLYLRGDPGSTLAMLAVCPDGGMSVMAEVPIPNEGHASTVDAQGNAWVADATTGSVFRISDPFASTR
jgi:DNA-binding beta-propeller fold protein YncE